MLNLLFTTTQKWNAAMVSCLEASVRICPNLKIVSSNNRKNTWPAGAEEHASSSRSPTRKTDRLISSRTVNVTKNVDVYSTLVLQHLFNMSYFYLFF